MIKGNAVIVLGGEFEYIFFFKERIVRLVAKNGILIGVDSGADHINFMGLRPNLIIGDFDSISKSTENDFSKVEKLVFPPEKDMTDGELALREAVKRGYTEIIFFGSMGGRIDHLLQNIFLLELADSLGAHATIEYDKGTLELLTENNTEVVFKVAKGNTVSLIPISSIVEGVTTEGLRYSLKNAKIERGSSLGVSNVADINAVNKKVTVSLKKGKMLVIKNSIEV
ncbi:MAG: thiamine diphosphokinase [Clostridia bacterium]